MAITGKHVSLTPGDAFPDVSLSKVGGGTVSLRASGSKPKIVVVYRGQFCPFCRGTIG